MTKILVTTDFSINSKAAIYFAIQLAKQMPVSITFFHSYHILRPSSFSEAKFKAYEEEEKEKITVRLKDFVKEVVKDSGIVENKFIYVTKQSIVPDGNILNYARLGAFDYICMGTRGIGRVEKVFGTNTSHVISKSDIPVIAVPQDYESKRIRHFLYASDLVSFESEIKKVIQLARPLQVKLEVLNFSFPSEIDQNNLRARHFQKRSDYPLVFNMQKNNFQKTLVENIASATDSSKPSLLVMFTNQNRPFLEKFLFSSNSEDVAFTTKVPLLVFKKDK